MTSPLGYVELMRDAGWGVCGSVSDANAYLGISVA